MSKPPKSFKALLKGGKLPTRIVPIKNEDKDNLDDKWTKGRDRLDFPVMRAVISGQPGSGKSTWIKNVILRRAKKGKPYEKIFCVVGSNSTGEWKGIKNLEILVHEMPPEEELTKPNRLLIVDDVDFSDMQKNDQALLTMTYRHFSSHYGLDVITTHHNMIDIPKTVRRSANLFVIFRQPDLVEAKKTLGKRAGLSGEQAERVFSLLKNPWDHILVDMIQGTQFPLRLNSVEAIRLSNQR